MNMFWNIWRIQPTPPRLHQVLLFLQYLQNLLKKFRKKISALYSHSLRWTGGTFSPGGIFLIVTEDINLQRIQDQLYSSSIYFIYDFSLYSDRPNLSTYFPVINKLVQYQSSYSSDVLKPVQTASIQSLAVQLIVQSGLTEVLVFEAII